MSKKSKQGATASFTQNVDAAECEFEGRFVPWGRNQMLLIDDESPALHRWFITEIEQLRKENENLKSKVATRDLNLRYLRKLLGDESGIDLDRGIDCPTSPRYGQISVIDAVKQEDAEAGGEA